MRRIFALVAGLALLAGACTTSGGRGNITVDGFAGRFDPTAISFSAKLTPFQACDGVLAHFKAEALKRVGPYGLEGQRYYILEGDVVASEAGGRDDFGAAPATTVAASTGSGQAVDPTFSGTNVQVMGVDEPDIVKTDGSRIVAIVDGVIRYFDVTGDEPVLVDSLRLESGWGHRFFIDGDSAFVFSSGDIWGIPMFAEDAARIAPGGWGQPISVVQEIDLSDPSNLRVVRTVRIDGSYLSARAVDGSIHMVVSSYPSSLPFVYPSNEGAEQIALEANKKIIEQSTIDTWLPNYTTYDAEGRETGSGLLVDCARMHRPAEFAGFDTLSVTTLDLDAGLKVGGGTGVIAQGQTVYASTESLYVATNVWVPQDAVSGNSDFREFEERYETALHKFDLSGATAQYRASGSVKGHLLNQFALDEFEGNLRVATTDGSPWGDDSSSSQVVVLSEKDGVLEQVGRVGNLGKGERIYSVRFMGETGFVVTFRQVDPLYVLDLRDATAPKVTGELKIPGYSAYLHPLGDGKLLGVGQDADSQGRIKGAKVSLFDVSDPAAPKELSTWTMANANSDVEWDHLAFLAWAPADIVVLPMSNWQDQFYGAIVLKTDDGLREYGRVFHHLEKNTPGTDCQVLEPSAEWVEPGVIVQVCAEDDQGGYYSGPCEKMPVDDAGWVAEEFGVEFDDAPSSSRIEICWPDYGNQDPQILRSIVIGDTLWTLSWRALQSNAIDGLEVGDTIWFG